MAEAGPAPWTRATGATLQELAAAVRLPGGLSRSVWLLAGEPDSVLRIVPAAEARRELATLERLDGLDGLAPRLLGHCSGPDGLTATRVTRLPGSRRLPVWEDRELAELSSVVHRLHAREAGACRRPPRVTGSPPPTGCGEPSPEPPRRPSGWPAPRGECLIHGDLQPFNLLWQDGHVTGLVDWPGAGRGSTSVKLGHLLLNLAIATSAERALRFLDIHRARPGPSLHLETMVWTICHWSPDRTATIPVQAAGIGSIDVDHMALRVQELVEALLTRAA